MNIIKKWLVKNGFNFKEITLTDGNFGLMVDTNYSGLYPTKETFTKINMIESKCKRFKKVITETRGYYTAVLIKEI